MSAADARLDSCRSRGHRDGRGRQSRQGDRRGTRPPRRLSRDCRPRWPRRERACSRRLRGSGGTALAVETDVLAQASSANACWPTAIARFGQVDCLVNNAGMLGPIRPTAGRRPTRRWTGYSPSTSESVFTCTRLVARHMIERAQGRHRHHRVRGRQGRTPGRMSIYGAEQGGGDRLHQVVGEGAGRRTACGSTALSPALIEATGMRAEMPEWFSAEFGQPHSDGTAGARRRGRHVVAFLLSDDASFVTGACYDVSGGGPPTDTRMSHGDASTALPSSRPSAKPARPDAAVSRW